MFCDLHRLSTHQHNTVSSRARQPPPVTAAGPRQWRGAVTVTTRDCPPAVGVTVCHVLRRTQAGRPSRLRRGCEGPSGFVRSLAAAEMDCIQSTTERAGKGISIVDANVSILNISVTAFC